MIHDDDDAGKLYEHIDSADFETLNGDLDQDTLEDTSRPKNKIHQKFNSSHLNQNVQPHPTTSLNDLFVASE